MVSQLQHENRRRDWALRPGCQHRTAADDRITILGGSGVQQAKTLPEQSTEEAPKVIVGVCE